MLYNAHRLFELGTNRLVSPHPVYSGNHKLEGILVAAGPSFEGSAVAPRVPLVSVAPVVYELQGVRPPYEMDADPFAKLGREPHEVVATGPVAEQAPAPEVFSQSESDALAERLRDLGYI
jgi:hypothetical protein